MVKTNQEKAIAELARKCNHIVLAVWAADCAERVLPYFEANYPQDNRPRLAIEAVRAWVRGEMKMTEARKAAFAAHAAARAADPVTGRTCSAARAAGHAAATAHVATHAVHAAAYAATSVRDTNGDTVEEREWQYQHLLELPESQPNPTG